MKINTVFTFMAAAALFGVHLFAAAPTSSLRADLENALASHAKACKSGKESQIAKTMCLYRLTVIKNRLADAKKTLTDELIRGYAENLPDLSKENFLGVLEKGGTAGLTCKHDEQPRDGAVKPKVDFCIVKFIKEDGVWKVDAVGEYEADKFDARGKERALDMSSFPPELRIDGMAPVTPGPAATPDFVGGFDIFSLGYITAVSVNGVEQDTAVNTSSSGQMKGGLKKGVNDIVISISKSERNTTFKLVRKAIIRIENCRQPTHTVYFTN
jgi:hypothetical protein